MWSMLNNWGKVGLIGGTAGGVIGVVAALVAAFSGAGGTGNKIVGLVVVLVFVVVFAGAFTFAYKKIFAPVIKQRKLGKTGLPAEATVLAVEETNITVNNIYPVIKLKLQVRPPGKEPYEAEIQTIIGRLNIPQVQPGAALLVKYDPDDPSNVSLSGGDEAAPLQAATALSPLAPGGLNPNAAVSEHQRQMEEFLKEAEAKSQEILKTGQPAPALIVQASSLDVFVNGNNPAMSFILQVKPEGGEPFQAQVTGVIGEAAIPKYQPGKIIFVKYDPGDQSRVALDHS